MKNEILEITSEWLSLVIPIINPISKTIENVYSLSDKILFNKIYNIIKDQDSDFDKWLKISEKFTEDSKSYYKMVRQIIYTINAINEEDMLYAYANLLRAYKNGCICKDDFLRLGFCLTKILSQDAEFLKNNIKKNRIEENIFCLSLSSINLMYNQTRGMDEKSMKEHTEYYSFTKMGEMLDKYSLSFGDDNKYNYSLNDEHLSNQKLEYSYFDDADTMEF